MGLILVAGLVGGRGGIGYGSRDAVARRVHVVRQGESLWTIAQRITGPQGDPRPVVDRIVAMNHVRQGVIQPGQELRVP